MTSVTSRINPLFYCYITSWVTGSFWRERCLCWKQFRTMSVIPSFALLNDAICHKILRKKGQIARHQSTSAPVFVMQTSMRCSVLSNWFYFNTVTFILFALRVNVFYNDNHWYFRHTWRNSQIFWHKLVIALPYRFVIFRILQKKWLCLWRFLKNWRGKWSD